MRLEPLLTLLVAWLIPGGGHILTGKTGKGLFFFALLFLTFLAGLALADFRSIRLVSDNPFYYVGHFGSGMTLFLTQFAASDHPRQWMPARYYEAGLLYMSVSGLLNVLVMMSLRPGAAPVPAAAKGEEVRS